MLSKPLYNLPLMFLFSSVAYAGDLGDQQDVGKDDKPASIDLRAVLRVDSQKLLLTREDPSLPSSGNTLNNEEANYKRSTTSLLLLTEIDLAAKVGLFGALPIVLSDSQTLTFSSTSSLQSDGVISANAPTNINRKGVGNATLGVKFHLASQSRESTQPFWTLAVAGHLPTGEQMVAGGTGVSDGLIGLSGELLFSRRFGQLQPYASFAYLGRFESSDDPLFRDLGRGQRSIRPGHKGGSTFGLQYVAYELEEETKISIDLGGEFHFTTLGRDYTPLFDFTAETDPTQNALRGVDSAGAVSDTTAFDGLLDEEQHTESSFHLGVDARVATNIRLQALLGLTHVADHFLTFGSAGVDNNGDGVVTDFEEQNPFFQPEIDTPGTRIRAEQNNTFTFGFNLGANF